MQPKAPSVIRESKLKPHTSYFICTTPRSGSSLLCNALTSTEIAGNPDEYFGKDDQPAWNKMWKPAASNSEHLNRVFREATTANGVCGVKVFIVDGYMDDYLFDFTRKASELPQYEGRAMSPPELLSDLFPNLHYIWLTRRDKVRQAVSLFKALQTKIWISFRRRENRVPQPAAYDFNRIHRCLQYLVLQEAGWQEYFTSASMTPLTIVYEDFVNEYEETIWRVLDYLGLEHPDGLRLPLPFLVKQADDESEEWVQRYHEQANRGSHKTSGAGHPSTEAMESRSSGAL
jgi:LPS sulfotransferase NodH